jgi:hypothetical protein
LRSKLASSVLLVHCIVIFKTLLLEKRKMETGTQTKTAWALWIRDLAEMLEPLLAEVEHQGELKLWHSEPLAHGRLLHVMIHWENRWATTPMLLPPSAANHRLPAPNVLGRTSADQTGESQASSDIPQPPLG